MRLKENLLRNNCETEDISIPTGAIKSVYIDKDVAILAYISIPTGAIKRREGAGEVRKAPEFQFLLVRLKE